MTDDLPFDGPTTQPNLGAPAPRTAHRHRWTVTPEGVACALRGCGKAQNLVTSRRGRTNRQRGNAIERWVCARLGISRVGQYGGKEDGGKAHDWMVIQVKSGGAYPERIDGLVRSLTPNAEQLRAVVHTDAPGGGRKRRALITCDFEEFVAWFGAAKGDE